MRSRKTSRFIALAPLARLGIPRALGLAMTNHSHLTLETSGAPIKAWTVGVPFEAEAEAQLRRVAALPFIHKWVAVMPDVHAGIGATVGSVVATRGAIIPAAVGVDIGCGMIAVQTTLTAADLPDSLGSLRTGIGRCVPHGFVSVRGRSRSGAWDVTPASVVSRWGKLADRMAKIVEKHPRLKPQAPQK